MEAVRQLGNILTALSLLAVAWDYHATVCRRRGAPTVWRRLTAPISAWFLRQVTTPRDITVKVQSAIGLADAMAAGVVTTGELDTIDKLAAELRRLREQHDRDITEVRDEIGKVRDERREAIKRLEEQIAAVRDELRRTAEDIEVGNEGLRSAEYAFASVGFTLAAWPQPFADIGLLVGVTVLAGVMLVLRSVGRTS